MLKFGENKNSPEHDERRLYASIVEDSARDIDQEHLAPRLIIEVAATVQLVVCSPNQTVKVGHGIRWQLIRIRQRQVSACSPVERSKTG